MVDDFFDVAITRDRESEFLRFALEDLKRGEDGMGMFLPRNHEGMLKGGGEKKLVAIPAQPGELGLDHEPRFAIFNPAVEGDVFDLGHSVGRGGGT